MRIAAPKIKETIPESFLEVAKNYPHKVALRYKQNDVYFSITFQDLEEKIKCFAAGLQYLGIKEGDKVAILSENRPEWVIADLGAMLIGAISVPLHSTFNPKALKHVLNFSEAKILIVSKSELLTKVLLVQKKLTFLKEIVVLERNAFHLGAKECEKKILTWNELLSLEEKNNLKPASQKPDDICSIICTSGTTGIPKGVMLTHKNFLSNVLAVSQVVPLYKNDELLSFLPLSHVFERLAGYYIPLLCGVTISYSENVKKLAQNLKEIEPTILISVPRVFEKFEDAILDRINASSFFKKEVSHWALKQRKKSIRYKIADKLVFSKIRLGLGGRLRLTISGGAPLDEKIARFFCKIGILVLEGFGLTETSPVVSVNCEKEFKFGTVGKPISGVEVKISPEKEILVRGPNIMAGYFKNPEETKAVIDNEGWFFTGDLGFIDKEGFLTVIGRKKEMIVTSGGKNVWPEPIENQLNRDPYVEQSMIIGNNRRFISALIVPDWQEIEIFLKKNNLPVKPPEKLIKDQKILEVFQERINIINQNLSEYEQIKGFKILEQFFSQEKGELTPTLKLRRHIIEKHYQREIEELYE